MIVSTKGRYALRVMLCFAQRGGDEFIPLKEIAEAEDISQKYLESIMTILSKAGFVDAKFETFGCGSAIASSSMATEMIMGKPVSQALELTNKAVVEALDGLPAHKVHCSVLAEEAIKNALKDYFDKNGIAYDPEQFKETDHDELHAQVHGE